MSIEIKIADGRSELYQWDTERMLDITADSVVTEVHFAIGKTDSALTCKPTLKSEDGTFKYTVTIPNAVLQKSGLLFVYLYLADNSGGQTIHCVKFRVVPKPKPNDYPTVEDELNEKIAKKGDTLDYSDNILSLLSGENVLSKVEVGNLTELDLSAYTEDSYLTIDNDVFNDFEIGIVSKGGYFGDTFGTVISLPFEDDMEKELEGTFNEKQVFELGKGTIIAVDKPSSEFSEAIARVITIINRDKIRTVFLFNSNESESVSLYSAVAPVSDTDENANMPSMLEIETYNFPYYLYNLREKIISNNDELTNSLNIYLDSIYNKLAKKQDSLTAGDGIKLDNSKISVETDNLDVSNSKATATVDGTEQTKTLSEMLGMVMSSSSGVTDYTKLDNLPYKVITENDLQDITYEGTTFKGLDLDTLDSGSYYFSIPYTFEDYVENENCAILKWIGENNEVVMCPLVNTSEVHKSDTVLLVKIYGALVCILTNYSDCGNSSSNNIGGYILANMYEIYKIQNVLEKSYGNYSFYLLSKTTDTLYFRDYEQYKSSYTYNELGSLTLVQASFTQPSGDRAYDKNKEYTITFTANNTKLTYPSNWYWSGDDVENNVFTPQNGKRYTLKAWCDFYGWRIDVISITYP